MRLFISYARVDSPFCRTVVDLLKAHETWHDERLYVGQKWWQIIVDQINRCEGFIFLVSAASVKSEYCIRELNLAMNKGKRIFPVLVEKTQHIPQSLLSLNMIDMSSGLVTEKATCLLDDILDEERRIWGWPAQDTYMPSPNEARLTQPDFNQNSFVADAIVAIERLDYDAAIYLLRYAKENHIVSMSTVNLDKLLIFAEDELAKRSEEVEAQRDYKNILALVRQSHTRELGCTVFSSFREKYPHYDPDGIAAMCSTLSLPAFLWCEVSEGEVYLERGDMPRITYWVDAFMMSKYPITNAQFLSFISDPGGYHDDHWWGFSRESCQWRNYYKKSIRQTDEFGEHPRVNVSWYEAMAFCHWLSFKTGKSITLASEEQWQRAAQGQDLRQYPWGNQFDRNLCNSRESRQKRTTNVQRYVQGASPYGILDMVGNVWEWCRNMQRDSGSTPAHAVAERAIRGGSYRSSAARSRVSYRVFMNPAARYGSIGFRVVMTKD